MQMAGEEQWLIGAVSRRQCVFLGKDRDRRTGCQHIRSQTEQFYWHS